MIDYHKISKIEDYTNGTNNTFIAYKDGVIYIPYMKGDNTTCAGLQRVVIDSYYSLEPSDNLIFKISGDILSASESATIYDKKLNHRFFDHISKICGRIKYLFYFESYKTEYDAIRVYDPKIKFITREDIDTVRFELFFYAEKKSDAEPTIQIADEKNRNGMVYTKVSTSADIIKQDCSSLVRETYEDLLIRLKDNRYNIRNMKFHGKATIVEWEDGTSTKVILQSGDKQDIEKAIAMCFMKKACGKDSLRDIFKEAEEKYKLDKKMDSDRAKKRAEKKDSSR